MGLTPINEEFHSFRIKTRTIIEVLNNLFTCWGVPFLSRSTKDKYFWKETFHSVDRLRNFLFIQCGEIRRYVLFYFPLMLSISWKDNFSPDSEPAYLYLITLFGSLSLWSQNNCVIQYKNKESMYAELFLTQYLTNAFRIYIKVWLKILPSICQ